MNLTLLAFVAKRCAAERRAAAPLLPGARYPLLSINISHPPVPQQQTLRTPQCKMGQTDGETLYHYTYPVAYYPSSVNNT